MSSCFGYQSIKQSIATSPFRKKTLALLISHLYCLLFAPGRTSSFFSIGRFEAFLEQSSTVPVPSSLARRHSCASFWRTVWCPAYLSMFVSVCLSLSVSVHLHLCLCISLCPCRCLCMIRKDILPIQHPIFSSCKYPNFSQHNLLHNTNLRNLLCCSQSHIFTHDNKILSTLKKKSIPRESNLHLPIYLVSAAPIYTSGARPSKHGVWIRGRDSVAVCIFHPLPSRQSV